MGSKLATRARQARIRAGFARESDAAKVIGCSRPLVIRWENGEADSIGGKYLLAAARAYRVKPEWLSLDDDDDGYPWGPGTAAQSQSQSARLDAEKLAGLIETMDIDCAAHVAAISKGRLLAAFCCLWITTVRRLADFLNVSLLTGCQPPDILLSPAGDGPATRRTEMTHAYHPACGCSACCDDELAEERRDEYIEDFAPVAAEKILGRECFAEGALNDLSDEVLAAFATDLGTFFERFHNATTAADEAAAGYDLYRALKPHIEAAALEQAREEVAAEYDRLEAA